jgi:hypothetical protein
MKQMQRSHDLLCSPLPLIEHRGNIHVRRNDRAVIPPNDSEIDDDVADLTSQDPHQLQQQQQVAYPTSGTRQAKGEEDQAEVSKGDDDMAASWAGQPAIKGSTELRRMALLTFCLIGLS